MTREEIPHIPLLLAPAGSYDALIAAIAAGADAVYLGGKNYGARQFAENFSDNEISMAIRYAHLRGVEIYLTINTLITEHELEDALRYVLFLFEKGVDAVLIQDTGLASLVRKTIPDLTLHASTQMGIHNSPGAIFAASRGFRRIVLARELTSDEVKEIASSLEGTGCDLEIFLHGALCYAYSGKCLLSSLIGGRSGNRGMCAQPCRKPYVIISGEQDMLGRICNPRPEKRELSYLLSTKDLCLYPNLDLICKLPVAALKIEGRMRSPKYVATVVSVYRRALDKIRAGEFIPDSGEYSDLAVAFSRGFTSGYISGEDFSNVMGRNYPGNQGYYIGSVIGDRKGKIAIKIQNSVIPALGDGIVISDKNDSHGFIIRKKPYFREGILEIEADIKPTIGSFVFITSRRELDRRIDSLLAGPDLIFEGSISISCLVEISQDGSVGGSGNLNFKDRIIHFTYKGNSKLEPSKTISLTKKNIINQLNKTKGKIHRFKDIEVKGEQGWFAQPRILNELRYNILYAAESALIETYLPSNSSIFEAHKAVEEVFNHSFDGYLKVEEKKPKLVVIVSSKEEADGVLTSGADYVYLQWNPDISDPQYFSNMSDRKGIMIPAILRTAEIEHCIGYIRQIISNNPRRILVDSNGVAEYIRGKVDQSVFSGYYGLNITNSATVKTLSGFEFCTLSPELSKGEISDIAAGCNNPDLKQGLAILVHGLIEAAVTKDNLQSQVPGRNDSGGDKEKSNSKIRFAIMDEKKYLFPFLCDQSGRTHILNSAEHCLIDEISFLHNTGIKWFLLDARYRGAAYASEITGLWLRAIDLLNFSGSEVELERIKDMMLSMSSGGITRSGFNRGISRKIKI